MAAGTGYSYEYGSPDPISEDKPTEESTMQRYTRLRLTTVLVAFASLTFMAATSTKAFNPLEAVPTGAMAVLTVGNPSMLFLNGTDFLRGAGLDEPAASLEEFMSSLLSPAGDDPPPESARSIIRAVDLNRRFIMAVYPGTDGAERPAALLFIPLRTALSMEEQSGLSAAIDEMLSSETGLRSVSIDYPGYAVVRTDGSEIPAYGSGSTMNLARLSSYPASSVAVWANPGAGAQYLDMLPAGLGSLLPGQDDGYQDDYEDWSEDLPLDAEAEGLVDNEAWVENEAPVDNEAAPDSGTIVDNEASGASMDTGAAEAETSPINNEPVEEYTEEYAEDFSWDEIPDVEEAEAEAATDLFSGQLGKLNQLSDILKKSLEELSGIEFTVTVQKDRVWVRAGVELKAGGTLAPLFSRAATGDASLPYLSYCDADALFSVAWSAPYDWSLPLMDALYTLVLPNKELASAALASIREYARATGMNGGMSFGVQPSDELMQAIRSGINTGDENFMKLLTRGLGIKVSGALELTDRQAFRDAAAKAIDFAKDPAYTEMLASTGFSIDIDRSVGVVEGLPYDAYTYSFGTQGESGDEATAVAELMGKLVSPVYIYQEDKAFLGLGPIREAVAAIPRTGARQPLRADRTFKALRAGAPAETRALFYLSTKALSRLVLRTRPDGQAALGYHAGKLSGFLSWLDASPTTVGFGMGIGAEDIKAIMAVLD